MKNIFFKILGILWMSGGLYCFIRPYSLVRRLERKGIKTIRNALIGLGLFINSLIITYGFQHKGFWYKIIIIIGIIGIIKTFFFLKSKYSNTLINFFLNLPKLHLRILSLLYTLIGYFIFNMK